MPTTDLLAFGLRLVVGPRARTAPVTSPPISTLQTLLALEPRVLELGQGVIRGDQFVG